MREKDIIYGKFYLIPFGKFKTIGKCNSLIGQGYGFITSLREDIVHVEHPKDVIRPATDEEVKLWIKSNKEIIGKYIDYLGKNQEYYNYQKIVWSDNWKK